MLQSLTIKNVALISSLTIDFGQGFNVLLGETGAGKSIIFDALNFVLGSKADKTLIRTGEDSMRVDALFTSLSKTAIESLKEFGYDEDEISLSRTMNVDGKSIIRINGIASTLSVLKIVGQILVDSYSQHESIDLLKSKNHLSMVDKFAGEQIRSLKDKVKLDYEEYHNILSQITSLGGDRFERERTKSMLEYEVKQREDASLTPNEDVEIKQRRDLLNSSEKILQAINTCLEELAENNQSAINLLQLSSLALSGLTTFDKLYESKQRLDSLRYELEDICDGLVSLKDSIDFDEQELELMDRRYDLIKSLTSKYGGSIEKALEYLDSAKNRLMQLEDSDYLIEKLNKQKDKVYENLLISCEKLSLKRREIAEIIESKITKELKELNMKSSKFKVKFSRLKEPTSNGYDDVEFEFSANLGQDIKALSKTASGGELSRFMLAIKNIFAQIGSAQTLIFDEIDAGISGETGNVVGAKLNNITSFAQVICITHLPQVASYGDNFYYVSKMTRDGNTFTEVKELHGQDIIYNIARIIGGDSVSEIALKHAQEMREKTGKAV